MPKKIDTITPEQQARFPEWVDKWTKVGLSCEPADWERAKAAVRRAYSVCALAQPKLIIHVSSPMAAVRAGPYAILKMNAGTKPKDIDIENMEPIDGLKQAIKDGMENYRGGAFWASWVSYITFFRDVMGWENESLDVFRIDEELTLSCGWVWWHEDVCVISDRPACINLDDRGRLHCEDGPSIAFRDGWSLYSWHGVTVPEEIIMQPETITVEKIDACNNQEIRRVMMERMGYDRYIAGSPVVHEDETGKLRKKTNKHGDELAVVEVLNGTLEPDGTRKTYFLAVPPEMQSAQEAVAWTYGMSVEEYDGLEART